MSIYVIHSPESGLAKIGYSASPRRRLSKMTTDSPTPLLLVAVLDGDEGVEAELHSRFRHLHERGEWFRVESELEAFILANSAPPSDKRARQWHKPPASDLAAKRRELGLNQEQLAALLGITQGTVSRNETCADPDKRYILSLDALAVRHGHGENLAATAEQAKAA